MFTQHCGDLLFFDMNACGDGSNRDEDDDFFGPQGETVRVDNLELSHIRERLETQGFRDAISAYSERTAQTGFDRGFVSAVRDTERAASLLGTIEAVLSCSPSVNSTKWPVAPFKLDVEQRDVLEACRIALRSVLRNQDGHVRCAVVAAAERDYYMAISAAASVESQDEAPTCSCERDYDEHASGIRVERMMRESRYLVVKAERILNALGLLL